MTTRPYIMCIGGTQWLLVCSGESLTTRQQACRAAGVFLCSCAATAHAVSGPDRSCFKITETNSLTALAAVALILTLCPGAQTQWDRAGEEARPQDHACKGISLLLSYQQQHQPALCQHISMATNSTTSSSSLSCLHNHCCSSSCLLLMVCQAGLAYALDVVDHCPRVQVIALCAVLGHRLPFVTLKSVDSLPLLCR